MNCEMGKHIRPEGWHNWGNAKNEETARYAEYNNHGAGASTKNRVKWSKQLTKKEAAKASGAIEKKLLISVILKPKSGINPCMKHTVHIRRKLCHRAVFSSLSARLSLG